MEKDLVIAKLKESLEKDFGESGRTQYLIEKLQNNLPFPKSDQRYIDRMIKLCEPIIKEPESKETAEIKSPLDLIKCYHCDLDIKLDEKSIRSDDFWFHARCFEKIPIVKTQVPQKIQVQPKITRHPVLVESKPTNPQMVFSGGLLASLVGTTYLLAGEVPAVIVGIWGSILYFAIYKSQMFSKKKQIASVVKTGIPGFDSTL